MNKLASLLLILFMLSCSHKMNLSGKYSMDFSRKEMPHKLNLYGKYSRDFSLEEIKQLNTHHGDLYIKTKVFIDGVVVKNVKKIGFYTYKIHNNSSVGVKHKLLKFESKIVFASNDVEKNKLLFSQFQKDYSTFFRDKNMEIIKESFIEGPEMIGRFL